ncbi:MAG: alpha/beta hydrolase [Rhizomicrobium sp.]
MPEITLANRPEGPPRRWPDGFFTVKDGTRLHYVEAGAGWPVVLIHGARGSAIGNWFSNGIAPKLAQTNKVYALDMRDHGLSDAQKPLDHDAMAEDILEFMDQKGIEKAHMGGFSMGAFLLVRLMIRAPERFITCCFQGGGLRETPEWLTRIPPDKEGRDPDQDRAEALVRQRRRAKGAEIGNNFSDRPPDGDGANRFPPDLQERFRKRDAEFAAFDLSSIKFPVMAINGEFDRPRAMTHRLWRELDDFTNVVLPGKGHLTSMMAGFIPQTYIDRYASFVVSHNPAP